MLEPVLSALERLSPRWKFLLTASIMLAAINLSMGVFGPFSPSGFSAGESASYFLLAAFFLAVCWGIMRFAPKAGASGKKFAKAVKYANGSMLFLSVFTGWFAVWVPIPVLEREFGREAAHTIFFRIHGLGTAFGLLFGVVGISLSIFVCRRVLNLGCSKK